MAVEKEEANKIRSERNPSDDPHRLDARPDGMEHFVEGFHEDTHAKGEHEAALRQSSSRLPARRACKHEKAEPVYQGITQHVEGVREERCGMGEQACPAFHKKHQRVDR